MKYSFFIYLVLLIIVPWNMESQSLEWEFAPNASFVGDNVSGTVCRNNSICYSINYTPSYTGTMTSYTLSFEGDCGNEGSPITSITPSVAGLVDRSEVTDVCNTSAAFYFTVGAAGSAAVTSGVTISIAQVCMDVPDAVVYNIIEDSFSGLEVSIDSLVNPEDNPVYLIDEPTFVGYDVSNDDCQCFKLTTNSGAASPTLECLTSLIPIQYELINCDAADIIGLPSTFAVTNLNNILTITGAPDRIENLEYTISAPTCDCKDLTENINIDPSAVIWKYNCYEDLDDVTFEAMVGDTIEIFKDVVVQLPFTFPSGIHFIIHSPAMLKFTN